MKFEDLDVGCYAVASDRSFNPDLDLSAETIEHRSFSQSRKGFDRTEVRSYLIRLAAHVRNQDRKIYELEAQLQDANRRAIALDELDDSEVLRRFGETTARLLSDAHITAAEIRENARIDALKIAAEFDKEIDATRVAAENRAKEVIEDAVAQKARLIAQADEEINARLAEIERKANELRRSAEADASRYASVTLERSRDLVFEAQEARERLLRDLARRGRIANAQVEQLKAGRERLLEAYRNVRKTLDDVTDDLTRADAEARAASDDAAIRMETVSEISSAHLISDLGLTREIEIPEEMEEILKPWVALGANDKISDGSSALAKVVNIMGNDAPHLRLIRNESPSGAASMSSKFDGDTASVISKVSSVGEPASVSDSDVDSDSVSVVVVDVNAINKSSRGVAADVSASDAGVTIGVQPNSSAPKKIETLSVNSEENNKNYEASQSSNASQNSSVSKGSNSRASKPEIPPSTINVDAIIARLQSEPDEKTQRSIQVADDHIIDLTDSKLTADLVVKKLQANLVSSGRQNSSQSGSSMTSMAISTPISALNSDSKSVPSDAKTGPVSNKKSGSVSNKFDEQIIYPDSVEIELDVKTKSLGGGLDLSSNVGGKELEDDELHGSAIDEIEVVDHVEVVVDETVDVVGSHTSVDDVSIIVETNEVEVDIEVVDETDDVKLVDDREPSREPLPMHIAKLFEKRDELLAPYSDRLIRALKRVLQDEQNELLDSLRATAKKVKSAKGGKIIPALPTRQAYVRPYISASTRILAEVASHGIEFSSGTRNPLVGSQFAISTRAQELAETIAGGLFDRIDQLFASLDVEAGVDERGLSDQLSSIYREWKMNRIDAPAQDAIFDVHAQASISATRPGIKLRWIVDSANHPCADGDDNALGGSVVAGQAFVTGHICPPVKPGCRCMVVVEHLAQG